MCLRDVLMPLRAGCMPKPSIDVLSVGEIPSVDRGCALPLPFSTQVVPGAVHAPRRKL